MGWWEDAWRQDDLRRDDALKQANPVYKDISGLYNDLANYLESEHADPKLAPRSYELLQDLQEGRSNIEDLLAGKSGSDVRKAPPDWALVYGLYRHAEENDWRGTWGAANLGDKDRIVLRGMHHIIRDWLKDPNAQVAAGLDPKTARNVSTHCATRDEALEESALRQFSDDNLAKNWECRQILRSWFPVLRKRASDNFYEYCTQLDDAVSVLDEIRSAFNWNRPLGQREKSVASYRLWAWPSEADVRREYSLDLDILTDALALYLTRPWLQHNAIDISAINALIYTPRVELVEATKSGALIAKPNWSYILSGGNIFARVGLALILPIVGFLARWIMLPALAVSLFVYGNYAGAAVTLSLWGAYLVYRLVKIPAYWRVRKFREELFKKNLELGVAMDQVWSAAQGSTINPSRLKELVLAAEERGALFRSALHTLIDRAIQLDPTALLYPQWTTDRQYDKGR